MNRGWRRAICRTAPALLVALCWPARAHAQISDSELFSFLSFLLLIPLGIVQTIVAAALHSRLTQPRGWATAFIAFGAVVLALILTLAGGGHRWSVVAVALVGFLAGLPVAIDLGRQKAWTALVLAVGLPAGFAAFLLLSGPS